MKVFLFIVIAGSMSNTTRNNQQRGNKTSTLQMQLFQNSDKKKLLSNAIALHQMTYIPTIRRRRKEREIRRLLGKSSHLNETRSHSLALSFFILILSGDIEQNPGPGIKFPCGVCKKSVRSNQRGVACDRCDLWFHTKCMGMNTLVYNGLRNVSWECLQCGMPNFSSSFLDEMNHKHDTNPYSLLSDTNSYTIPSLDSEQCGPIAQSSPLQKKQCSQRSNRPFKIVNLNLQSINNKKAEVLLMLERDNPDIVVGTETWLKPEVSNAEIFPSCYTIYRKDRADGYGGVILAVKTDFVSELINLPTDDNDIEAVFAKITLTNDSKVIIGAVYRPTNNDLTYAEKLTTHIHHVLRKHPKAVNWILGDFNLPDIDWQTRTVDGHQYLKSINETFLELCFNNQLDQIVTEPTRGENILDIFFTNRPSLINKCKIRPGLSDHDAVYIESSVRPKKIKPVPRKIHLWKKADLDQLKASCLLMVEAFNERFNTTSPVSQMWDFLKHHLLDLEDRCVPSKMTSTKYHQPWANRKIKRLSRKKRRWFRRYKITKNTRDKEIYDLLKRETRTACKQAYNSYLNQIFNDDGGQKRFWSYIKSKKTENSGVAPLTDSRGVTISASEGKADILNKQFTSVFGAKDSLEIPDIHWSYPKMQKISFTAEGIKKLLTELNEHKSKGPDNISAKLLKSLAGEISPALAVFFQATLEQGALPADWTHAKVTPIYKKGDRSLAENYRPVSLTSILCKTAEHIITSQIHRHLDNHHVLTDAQHGFRKNRSCESQLLLTTNDLHRTLEENGQVDLILLDFSKAFDKVPHSLLLHKLKNYGIDTAAVSWITAFLDGRTQEVLVEGQTSASSDVTSGVPQGSVLGPLLFLLFINDMPNYVSKDSTVRLFADDAVIYREIKTEQDSALLQQDLNSLLKWERDWGMSFHPSKCNVLRVTRRKKIVESKYSIRGHALELVDSAKYLGIILSKDMSWKTHIKMITSKANHTLSFLQRNITDCPKSLKELSYKTLVRPQLEYCSPIWDPYHQNQINQIEAVQNRAARFTCNDYSRYSSVTAMKNDLGWESLQARRKIGKVVLLYKILNNHIDVRLELRQSAVHPEKFTQLHCRTVAFQRSYIPDTIVIWNSLPSTLTSVVTVDAFRSGATSALISAY